MKGWRKRFAALSVLAVIVAAALTAGLASAHSNKAAKQGAGTLNIMGFGTGDDVAESRATIATKAVGGYVYRPSGSFNDQTFLAAVASGNAPDLVYLDRQKVGTYAAKGAFLPLTSCIKSQKINTKQYRIPAMNEITYKGKIYGIPEFYTCARSSSTTTCSTRQTSSSGARHVELAAAARDREEARQDRQREGDAHRLRPEDPRVLPAVGEGQWRRHPVQGRPHAAPERPEGGRGADLCGQPRSTRRAAGTSSSRSATRGTSSARTTSSPPNQVGAFPMEQWYYNVLAGSSPKVHDHRSQFRNKKRQPINYETGSAWAIPKGSKNAAAACTWMKTMTSVDRRGSPRQRTAPRSAAAKNQPYTGISTGNAVADQAIYTRRYTRVNPVLRPGGQEGDRTSSASRSASRPRPASAEFKQAWNDAVNRVLAGQQSPKQALDQAQKEAQSRAIKAATK